MKKRILFILTILLYLTWGADDIHAYVQDGNIVAIYVSHAGSFENEGNSWANAKNNLQSAIDVLYEHPDVREGTKKGYVFVAGTEDNGVGEDDGDPATLASYSATYIPTRRSTDDADGSAVNTSFRIYPNINVYGGFKGDEVVPASGTPEAEYCKSLKDLWKMRRLSTGIRYGELMALHDRNEVDNSRSWEFMYKSILSGNHHTTGYSFTYDKKRGVYTTVFPLSSYHVVWFGTCGTIDPSSVEEYEPNVDPVDPAKDRVTVVNLGKVIYYNLDSKAKTATVTRSPDNSYAGAITIPAEIMYNSVTYKVTSIRNGAFYECTGLTSINIGSNVTDIGQAAFYGCTGLTSVTLPAGLANIYRYAFYGCSNASFTTITFPSSIILIDRWAFANCTYLSEANIPESVNYIGRYAFRGTALPENTVLPAYEKEEESMTGRFKGLPFKARVSGFTIEGGNASSTNLQGHDHTGFGGGAYMVRNSVVEDCIIHHCSAVQRGGAVYLDGGGDLNYCYIHTCQATGFGMQQGYGGGACIDYDGQVEHCYIVQCAARVGAGLAICHDPDEYPEESAPKQDQTFYETYKDNEQLEASAYDPFAKATLIANCTSNAEGAGVYLNYGGSLDHLTVVNNECIGPDVIYYGMRHGRTGGIYVREAGAIYNSVAWGNKCKVNSDIQFAAFKKEDYYDITIDHSAFSKGDISDWSAVTRNAVINLNDANYPSAEFHSGNFPMFQHPTDTTGIMHSGGVVDTTATGRAAGKAYQDAYNWHPLGMSSMRGKGKQIVDVTIASRADLLHANADRDALGIKFESVSVCGAITNSYHEIAYALMPSLEGVEGRIPEETGDIPTLFVDKSMVATNATNEDGKVGYEEDQVIGASWTYPLNNFQDAVYYFSQYLKEDKLLKKYTKGQLDTVPGCLDEVLAGIAVTKEQYNTEGKKTLYRLPRLDSDGMVVKVEGVIQYDEYEHVQILVKEGTMNVAGRGAYLTGHIRTAAIRPSSNMRLYGGYPKTQVDNVDKTLTVKGRNPREYDSDVKADVTGGSFNDHSVHVFSIANHHDVIIDGFRLIGGNGNIASPDEMDDSPESLEEWEFYNSVANGGGLAMNNSNEAFPRDMTGNILRNCVISNCAAPEGAGIFVNGNADHGSESRKCKAELTVVNTVIRNCTAGDTYDNPDRFVANNITPILDQITLYGVVTANGEGANIYMRNSDVVNNCGFPFKCTPIEVIENTPGDATYGGRLTRTAAASDPEISKAGHVQVYNSVIFSNGLRVHADRGNIANTVFCPKESWFNVSGEYIYMGYDVLLPVDFVGDEGEAESTDANLEKRLNHKNIFRILTHFKSEDGADTLYYRINDGSQQGFDVKKGSEAQKNAMRVKNPRHPEFVNPARNVGHSTVEDKSFYGGDVNYEPLPTNPIVNAANAATTKDNGPGVNVNGKVCMNYDMALNTRDYGGDPDIGAIETTRLPANGTVLYVTPDGAGRRDGSSWANAIAGNTVYQLSAIAGPALATGDAIDAEPTCNRVMHRISEGVYSPVLTTDEKYCGGFGRVWFTDSKTGATSTSTVTTTYTIETNEYVGGSRDGETETVQDGTIPVTTIDPGEPTGGTTKPGFVAGYDYDSRYPYGEISGASRTFWRANPYSGKPSDYSTIGDFTAACSSNGWINNERSEKYVGGLQYAVETAAAYNALAEADPGRIAGVDSVQVWVSNGIYTDYKGFVMRDKTTVMGGFPAKDGGTPGLSERQALMSDVINIPKSLIAEEKGLIAKDYETILQISDVNPQGDNKTFNSTAVNFWDDDYKVSESTDTYTSKTKNVTITNHLKWNDREDQTSYIRYPDMLIGDANVFSKRNKRVKTHLVAPDGGETDGGIFWAEGSFRVSQWFGNNNNTDKSDSWQLIYADRSGNVDYSSFQFNQTRSVVDAFGNVVGSVTKGMEITGALLKTSAWQTIKNVPKGTYKLEVDLAAFYTATPSEENTGVSFSIVNSLGAISASQTIYCENSTTPYKLKRYVFEFTQPEAGNVSIRLISDPDAPESNDAVAPVIQKKVMMSNVHLYELLDNPKYVLDHKDETSTETTTGSSTATRTIYTSTTHRTTLRKRVLTMPDICVPTYGGGGIGDPVTNGYAFDDNLPHTDRIPTSSHTYNLRTARTLDVQPDNHYVDYTNVSWDGFTIRHGFIYDEAMPHGGGSGVNMYEGAHLRNSIVINNSSSAQRIKGGGIFCDGATSTIENCFVLDNQSTRGTTEGVTEMQIQIFAGGMFMYEGTCFNSLFAKNYSYGSSGGVGFCVGRFYNNTIAYNTCSLVEGGNISGGAISLATSSTPNLFVANTIIFGNNGIAIRDRNAGTGKVNPFLYCYIQSEIAQPNATTTQNVTNYDPAVDEAKAPANRNYGIGNVFLNGVACSAENTPFSADMDGGSYDAENPGAKEKNDFRLLSTNPSCINRGTEAFAGELYTALSYKGQSDVTIRNSFIYKSVASAELPDNDVAYANRIQDCRIDMGAYEYDGTRAIEPTLYPEDKKAIFYVTEEGYGTASASSASDAACAVKLQKVLDAAGRWRYASYKYDASTDPHDNTYDATQIHNNFKKAILQKELDDANCRKLKEDNPAIEGETLDAVLEAICRRDYAEVLDAMTDDDPSVPEEQWQSKAEKQAAYISNYITAQKAGYYNTNLPLLKDYEVIVRLEGNFDDGGEPFTYMPTRNSNPNLGDENILMYSLMVPHGIRVEGGYEDSFENERDILGRPTYLDGTISESGGKVYHVVTFTNDLYTTDEKYFEDGDNEIRNQLEFLGNKDTYSGTEEKQQQTVEYNRTVLDGLFVQNGNASGSDEDQKNGGAAIVTDFAHVRNCVIQGNTAIGCGGGLYLESHALVSGCVIKENNAQYGGGVYVFEPSAPDKDSYAYVISSTIANNIGTVSAGGLYFATNVRANSVVIWGNTANANPNVAGTDATGMTQLVENYPMNYCGVESRRMAGVNNIELPEKASYGVRWDGAMIYETTHTGELYFPITRASVLTRTGMPYSSYIEYLNKYPTLERADIFGLNRMEQDLEEYEEGDPPVKKYRNYQITLADGTHYDKEEKDNNFIEIGARVLNADFQVKLEFEHIMKRLFVTTTERLPTDSAVALQGNTLAAEWARRYPSDPLPTDASSAEAKARKKEVEDDVEMYQQMGSCFHNPFLRLSDALDYIVRVRQATNEDYYGPDGERIPIGPEKYKSVADVYKDQRFEVFVCGGTFYPYRDAYGEQGESRANTFLVPEGVTIVGGINHEEYGHAYCQAGHPADTVVDAGSNQGDPDFRPSFSVAGLKLFGATTYEIRTRREHMDRNGNNVSEPWEMEEQTILSGAAVQNDAKANVYHVITCLSNPEQVGQLPTRWSSDEPTRTDEDILPSVFVGVNPSAGDLLDNFEKETQKSRDARAILIDGVTITGGYANKIDAADESRIAQTMTYFRGGGILVEGNWDSEFDDEYNLPEVLGVAKRDIPLILTSCLIKDNVAGNGGGVYTNGTFYSFCCHYTQNLAIGPITPDDQEFIPWSAGGAIANNYQVHVWNSLFDNNEAQVALPILERMRKIDPDAGDGEDYSNWIKNPVYNANARQGYAGAISCSETGLVRACNCDFVRNKAVAFPAIYNFLDNNLRAASSALTPSQDHYYGRGWHFAVNTIFWGNEATGSTIAPAEGWEKSYYDGLYPGGWTDERKPYHVANYGPKLDVATLTFCSYEEETGRDGTVWWSNQDKAKSAPLKPKTYPAPIGELDGLTRLYAGLFTDVLDEYFGYYKNGFSDKPYYKEKIISEGPPPITQYIPSALDYEDLMWSGYEGDNKYVYTTTGGGAHSGHIDYSTISSITDDNTRYATAMSKLDAVAYNYNLVLSKENTEAGGPFFVLPSLSAGVDGYMETANWLVSRLNSTVDTGWGFLKQDVKQTDESTGLYETQLLMESGKKDGDDDILIPVGHKLALDGFGNPLKYYERYYTVAGSSTENNIGEEVYMIIPRGKKLGDSYYTTPEDLGTVTEDEVTRHYYRRVLNLVTDEDDHGESEYNPYNHECLEEQYHELYGDGFYNIHAKNIHLRFHHLGYPNLLPIGDDIYMNYVHEGETESKNMRRISTHPKMGVQDVFIDMGIYEYQYVQLVTSGSETDVIWVGPSNSGSGDGSSCRNATSDLQFAIETLLRSRNDHDKMIKMIGGTYYPQSAVNSTNKAFFIEVPSRTDGVTLPKTLNADDTHTVKSLTIRGGYATGTADLDDGESTRDIEAHPVVLEMRKETGNSEQSLSHLFIIEDAGEKGCYMNYLTRTNKDFKDNVMPIVLDGITFVNPYGEDDQYGGSAIYYKEQYKVKENGLNNFEPDMSHLLKACTYTDGTGEHAIPKLLIKNCIIKASGANEKVSAVKIEKGGGPSLVVNSVFHSNGGNPLEAINTNVVNCTFALNGGHVRLIDEQEVYYRPQDLPAEDPTPSADYPSGIYNSIIWRDNQVSSSTESLDRLQDLAHNKAYTEKATMPMMYNAITKKGSDPATKGLLYVENSTNVLDNAWLHRTNRNVSLGPNFIDPEGVTPEEGTEEQKLLSKKMSRDFHINPSAQFINKADAATYLSLVPFYAEQSVQKEITVVKGGDEQPPYIFQSVQRLDRPKIVVVNTVSHDCNPEALTEKNLKGTETTADFPDQAKEDWYPFRRTKATIETWDATADEKEKVIATPTDDQCPYTEYELAYKRRWDGAGIELGAYECSAALQRVLYVWEGASNTFDGSSWEHAFKRDELQSAIDVASVYSTIKSPRERAYVFVASDTYLKDTVYVRDGVSVYGGLKNDFYDEATHDADGNYSDDDINRYINLVCASRDPIAMSNASVSTIIGLRSDNNDDPSLGFLLDGFVISGGNNLTCSPVVADKRTVLKNVVITNNRMSSDAITGNVPIVDLSSGILYNSLIYGNTANTIVKIKDGSTTAGVLNCTVVADNTGEVAIASSVESSVVNTITYNEADKSIGRAGESDAEHPVFDHCNTVTSMFAPYLNTTNAYNGLLPNYLKSHRPYYYQLNELSECIDGGLRETTVMKNLIFKNTDVIVNFTDSVKNDVPVLAGDRDPLGNPRQLRGVPDIGCFETWKVTETSSATNATNVDYATHYGGHHYPHKGSVLYVMNDANLVIETYDNPATVAVTETDPIFTGEGALRPGYVLVKEGGSIYGQGNTLQFNYVAAERSFSNQQYALVAMPFDIKHKEDIAKTYAYSGDERSAYNYCFVDENSNAWQEITELTACDGWLADLGESVTDPVTKRFTGWGATSSDYAYSESGATKTIELTQYDKRIPGSNGSDLAFTRLEDMGWNLKGLPLLIANYQTNVLADETYNMNIPHIIYKNGGDYINNGSISSVQSWVSGTTLSPGEGFFTQTAVIGTYNSSTGEYVDMVEPLVFKIPMFSGAAPLLAPARPLVLVRDVDGNGDVVRADPDPGAPKEVNYSLGRDGVKWITNDAPQFYMLTASHSPLSLLGAAPTEVDIPLGVFVPEDPRYQDMPRYFTFSLPEPEAFKDYTHVWLIDKALNHVTNLVEQNYAAALSPGTDNSRFYLRIGGMPFGNGQRREYIVYAYKRQLHIRGLVEGDRIHVYSLTGQLILSTVAKDPEFTAELPQAGGIYAVRVNDFSTKVRNL